MTEKLYIGSETDCNTVRTALDFVMDFPKPPESGPFAVDEPTRLARVAAWFAMTQEERDAIIADPNDTDYEGWTLQYSSLVEEYTPGTRRGSWLPANVASEIAAASAAGRTLSIAQTLALTAAQAVWLNGTPANWIEPPP